jgi:hypothetical protein
MKPQDGAPLRRACRSLAAAKTDDAIRKSADALARDWAAARKQLDAAAPPLRRLPKPEDFRGWVLDQVAAGADRAELSQTVEAKLKALEQVASEANRPGGWADRWRLQRPILDQAEADKRLAQVRKATAGSARTAADAVRRVLAARREQGVPLYQTYATLARARYLAAVLEADLGLIPKAADGPPTDRPPWGTFRVRSDPKLAPAVFTHFPPFPARSELLQPTVSPAARPAAPDGGPAPDQGSAPARARPRTESRRSGGDR